MKLQQSRQSLAFSLVHPSVISTDNEQNCSFIQFAQKVLQAVFCVLHSILYTLGERTRDQSLCLVCSCGS